ncbi:MAG: hypothetical protein ACRETP_01630 [Steroidobacteraceae bacterium]
MALEPVDGFAVRSIIDHPRATPAYSRPDMTTQALFPTLIYTDGSCHQ